MLGEAETLGERLESGDATADKVGIGLDYLRKRLLDLTLRNAMLAYPMPSRASRGTKTSLQVIDAEPDGLYESLWQEKELAWLALPEPPDPQRPPTDLAAYARTHGIDPSLELSRESNDVPPADVRRGERSIQALLLPDELERRLRKIYTEARSAEEETGTNMLYLVFGFLRWRETETSETERYAPLVMLPVKLRRAPQANGTFTYYVGYSGEDIWDNVSLREKLREDFGLVLPDLEDEEAPQHYFAQVEQLTERRPGWAVSRQVVLGLLTFSKILMYLDLDAARWPGDARLDQHPVVRRLIAGAATTESAPLDHTSSSPPDIDGLGPVAHDIVFDADSSQHRALLEVRAGTNLVVEGPPGTGKSQTIANLIARELAHGRSVLFLAEKQTALEVVRRKLDQAGLGIFCLELHSHKTQKGQLHEDLKKRLELKGKFQEPAALSTHIAELEATKCRLSAHERLLETPFGGRGLRIREILWGAQRRRIKLRAEGGRWAAERLPGAPAWSEEHYQLAKQAVHAYADALSTVSKGSGIVSHPWRGLIHIVPRERVVPAVARVANAADQLVGIAETYEQVVRSPAPCGMAWRELGALLDSIAVSAADVDCGLLARLGPAEARQALSDFLGWCREYADRCRAVEALLRAQYTEVAPRVAPLLELRGALPESAILAYMPRLDGLFGVLSQRLHDFLRLGAEVANELGIPWRGLADAEALSETLALAIAARDLDPSMRVSRPRDAARLLPEATNEASKLRGERAELEGQFDMLAAERIGAEGLRALSATCSEAGLFRWLSRPYGSAKRQWRELELTPSNAGKDAMAAGFLKLARHLSAVDKFDRAPEHAEVFGQSFRGLRTDFEQLQRAVAWQFECSRPGEGSRFRQALERVSSEVLLRMAEVAASRPDLLEVPALLHELGQHGFVMDRADVHALSTQIESAHRAVRRFAACGLDARLTVGEALQGATAVAEAAYVGQQLDNHSGARALLGPAFAGVATPPTPLERALGLAERLLGADVPAPVREYCFAADLPERLPWLRALAESGARMNAELHAENEQLTAVGINASVFYEGKTHERDILSRCAQALRAVETLEEWTSFLRAIQRLQSAGVLPLESRLRELGDRATPIAAWERVDCAYYATLHDELINEHPSLEHTSGAELGASRARFRELDSEVVRLQSERFASLVDAAPVPLGNEQGRVHEYTDLGLVRHEANKIKKHIPIRQLVARASGALRALKPCFMMSPRSVAQYLPPDAPPFDLCIMDEASQLRPEDALGAIARSRQVVVVGDSKQLPPTAFFENRNDAEDDQGVDHLTKDKESILGVARSSFGVVDLQWHYRSRHESLITFSNQRYYGSRLKIFPTTGADREVGVQFHLVEAGRWDGEKNPREAEAVAEAVVRHLTERPKESLGVVAMNVKQRDELQGLIQKKLGERKMLDLLEDKPDGLFVKNLEAVQGDERDVIFISVTYGPRGNDKRVEKRFGPVNHENGWRRLNVLFTRARKRVEVFSSFRAADLHVEDRDPRGVRDLREYLEFAESGKLEQARLSRREPGSDFEVAVADVLSDHGYKVHCQIGVAGFYIDVGVLHPNDSSLCVLGIECDGATYHSSLSARDRDRLRQQVLESMGWRIYRVWSTDWFRQQKREVEKLLAEIERAVDAGGRLVRTPQLNVAGGGPNHVSDGARGLV